MSTPLAAERHPHLAEPVRSGWVRVDLHSHTMWSGDCTTTPDELVAAVEESQLDVLCITDHNAIAGAQALVDELPCRVVVGEEVRTNGGEVIGLFLRDRVPMGLTPTQAAEAIRAQGGLVYIPHPFDPKRGCLREDELVSLARARLIDAVEVRNAKTADERFNARAASFAAAHDLAPGAGSDAHVPQALGAAYVEVPAFEGPDDFLAGLRRGRVVGHHADPPRKWRARVVPSTGSG